MLSVDTVQVVLLGLGTGFGSALGIRRPDKAVSPTYFNT
jgi:hypothetical protein